MIFAAFLRDAVRSEISTFLEIGLQEKAEDLPLSGKVLFDRILKQLRLVVGLR